MTNDHLARAKEYIAKGDEYYAKAGDEIQAWLDEDVSRTQAQAAERVGKSESWVHRLLRARKNCDGDSTQPDWGSGSNKRDEVAAKVLREPERVDRLVREIPQADLEYLAQTAQSAAVERARAQRAEHQTEPTVHEITGGEKFDPAEYWADTLVIRLNRNARELASLINRAGGLLFGTMPPEEAFDYLYEAERLIAEARAAAQEIVRDKTEV